MITPEPMPLVGAPNGEKSLPEKPSAVVVTTDFCAVAMTSVRSAPWTVVDPVLAACAGVPAAAGVAAGLFATSVLTARAVPPDARTALRSETPRIVPARDRRRELRAGCTGAVATAAAPGSGDGRPVA